MRLTHAALADNPELAARVQAAFARDATQRSASTTVPHESFRSEAELHRAVIDMAAAECGPGVIVAHVPNGGKRNKIEAGRLKGMGTLAGMPDLIVLVAGRVYGLELKTAAGRLSAEQKAMAERFRRAGSEYEVARSVGDARQRLIAWGAIQSTTTSTARSAP